MKKDYLDKYIDTMPKMSLLVLLKRNNKAVYCGRKLKGKANISNVQLAILTEQLVHSLLHPKDKLIS